MHAYWSYIRKRAAASFRGTLNSALNWSGIVGVTILGLIAHRTGYVVTASEGWSGTAIFALLTTVATFLAFFAFRFLLVVPYQSDLAKLDKIAVLEKKIYDRDVRQQIYARLWELRKEGVEIRNQPVTQDTFQGWKGRFERWHEQVLNQAKMLSLNFHAWLFTLDRTRPEPSTSQAANEEHLTLRRVQSEILLRLQEFLQAEMMHDLRPPRSEE